jgi:hypothetical protein
MVRYMGDIIGICAPNGGFVTGLGVVPEQAKRDTIRSIIDLAKELCTPPYGKKK